MTTAEAPAITTAEHELVTYLREMTALARPASRPLVEGWAHTSQYDLLRFRGIGAAMVRSRR